LDETNNDFAGGCRGWRRSGKWLYKPIHSKTCCQLLTIRLNVDNFKISSSQRRVKRRWEGFLSGSSNIIIKSDFQTGSSCPVEGGSPKRPRDPDNVLSSQTPKRTISNVFNHTKRQRSNLSLKSLDKSVDEDSPSVRFSEMLRMGSMENIFESNQRMEVHMIMTSAAQSIEAALEASMLSGEIPKLEYQKVTMKEATDRARKLHGSNILCTSSICLEIAGKAKSQDINLTAESVSSILLDKVSFDSDSFYIDSSKGFLNIYSSENKSLPKPHGVERITKNSLSSCQTSLAKSFRLVMIPSHDPDIPEVEFELFKKYQITHHGDQPESVTKESFKRFLCDSPLIHVPSNVESSPSCGFGSFHQQYWVEDRLIAVGVVDILPHCLSSKYFFWDPSYAKLSLGTVASLLEIEWVREQSKTCRSFEYYYLGYYLHSCHRMRYKASFSPSELLCPTTFTWVSISDVMDQLDANQPPWNLAKSNRADDSENINNCGNGDLALESTNNVKLMITYPGSRGKLTFRSGKIVDFGTLKSMNIIRSSEAEADLEKRIKEWIKMVGPAWESMLYAV
jgi:arginine-tRNA-protein transferase